MNSICGKKSQSVELIHAIDNNIAFFDKNKKPLNYSLCQLKVAIEKCVNAAAVIETFARSYDFDDHTPGNGYRSFCNIIGSAIKKSGILVEQLIKARGKIFFSADNYNKYNVQRLLH